MHPVEAIVNAIATQEGWFSADPKAAPRTRNNPGDLRFAGQKNATAPGWVSGRNTPPPIATFVGDGFAPGAKYGATALFRDVWAKVVTGMTFRQIIMVYAPPNENDTAGYIKNMADWTGLPLDKPVISLIPDLVDMRVKGETT